MAILTGFLNVLLVLTSIFMICLILIQRGKGGGLAGAFGGMGGSSAFGTKAGDVFTRVTIYVALFWGFLAILLVYQYNRPAESAFGKDSATVSKIKGEDFLSGAKSKLKVKAEAGGTKSTDSGKDKDTKGTGSPAPDSGPVSIPAIPDEPASKK